MTELWNKFWALEVEVWKVIVFFVLALLACFCTGVWSEVRRMKRIRERIDQEMDKPITVRKPGDIDLI